MGGADLQDKVAVVTGAAQGIGRAIAQLLGRRAAKIVVNDISEQQAATTAAVIRKQGGTAIEVIADVTNAADVERMISVVVRKFSTIHILVNNAGVLRPTRLPHISEAEWDLVLSSNLKGTFLCSQAVLPYFVEQRWGRIVNVSSTAGKSVSTLGGVHYTAAKAGVLGLTRAFAKEMARYNIRVNAVCPGLVNTEMVRNNVSSEQLQSFVAGFPISRMCEPEEVAELVSLLLSDGSNYITWASCDINGGDLMI